MPIQQGVNEQTPAAQNVWRTTNGRRRGTTSSRRRSPKRAAKKASSPKRSASARRTNGGKLKRFVKGSPQAKAYMAKIRKLRK